MFVSTLCNYTILYKESKALKIMLPACSSYFLASSFLRPSSIKNLPKLDAVIPLLRATSSNFIRTDGSNLTPKKESLSSFFIFFTLVLFPLEFRLTLFYNDKHYYINKLYFITNIRKHKYEKRHQ